MLSWILDAVHPLKARLDQALLRRRWAKLQAMGLHLGQQCLILAHDAQMDEFLDAGLIGKITIHESCHFGSRTVILPGVEVGPRTMVGANSVVSRSLPADTVCAGTPAKVICSLDEYLERHISKMAAGRQFPWTEYNTSAWTPERRRELLA